VLHVVPSAEGSGGSGGGDGGANVTIEVSCRYELGCCVGTAPPRPAGALVGAAVPAFDAARAGAAGMWREFWGGGAFVDIAGRTADPRAAELERRAALLEPAQISRVSPRTVM